MGPIGVSELRGATHRGGADGAAAAAVVFGGSDDGRGREVGGEGGCSWRAAREDERGKERGGAF
jgi:hypothetical protein